MFECFQQVQIVIQANDDAIVFYPLQNTDEFTILVNELPLGGVWRSVDRAD